jgi:hypothetical protein
VFQYTSFREGVGTIAIGATDKNREFDTIVCPARADGFKHAFLENDSWWAIRISPSFIPQLKHIAMYETNPISQIRWIADIKQNGILPYKNSGKYIVYVENKKNIAAIKLDKGKKGIAPQAPRYTTHEKLTSAKRISDLW